MKIASPKIQASIQSEHDALLQAMQIGEIGVGIGGPTIQN
jgi:hypothetical protein